MDISVCICTHNRPDYVATCLEGLERQSLPPSRFAVILVDSGSTGDVPGQLADLADDYGARLLRLDQPGVSAARNAGLQAAETPFLAFVDDDAIPAPNWLEAILTVLAEAPAPPALLGGRILPSWEAPLPDWWPDSLRGVLSIIEHEGSGEYRRPGLPPALEPYAANMAVHVPTVLAAGGFADIAGRYGGALLSDEEVQLAWTLQNQGHRIWYDSRIVVHHQIQARRLCPEWLLSRLYWQGASTVVTRRLTGTPAAVWREVPRRLAVALLCAPSALCPWRSPVLLAARWRLAYAVGFLRAAYGWEAAATAARQGAAQVREKSWVRPRS